MDGLVVTLRVEVCGDIIIPATSTLSVEPSFEVQSSSTLDVEVCMDESTHDATFHVVGDQHTAESREDKNQTSLEEDVGYKTLHKDCKVEEEQMVFEEKSVVSCDASTGKFNIASWRS